MIVQDQALLPLPTDAAELARCLADPEWRLFSGCLYKIMIKGDDKIGADGSIEEGDSFVLPFKPNRAQKRFIRRLWHRNLILKARQLGFTTLIAVSGWITRCSTAISAAASSPRIGRRQRRSSATK